MDERTASRKRFLINLLFWLAVLVLLYGVFRYVVGWLMPLLIGLLIARLLNPLIRLTSRKARIPRKPAAFVFVVLFLGVIGTPLFFGISYLFHNLQGQVAQFGDYYNFTIEPALRETERWISQNMGMLFPDWEIDGEGGYIIALLGERVAALISGLDLVGWAAATPTLLLRILFTFLFTLFSTVYYEDALAFLLRQMNGEKRRFLSDTIISAKKTIANYFGAYLKIMAVTFVELLIGLSIIRGSFSIIPALTIAMVDFLPAVGCGTVLIPWAIIAFITGDAALGVGLLILYLIIFVIRQFIEPKIVGDQLGINPLLTLVSMYIGFLTVGILGLIIMPIIVTIIADLQKKDMIHLVN